MKRIRFFDSLTCIATVVLALFLVIALAWTTSPLTSFTVQAAYAIGNDADGNADNETEPALPDNDGNNMAESGEGEFSAGDGTLAIMADRGKFDVYALLYGEVNPKAGIRNYAWAPQSTPDEFWMYVQRTVTDDYYYDTSKREQLAEWMLDEYEKNPEELAVRLARIAADHATPVEKGLAPGDKAQLCSGYYLVTSTEAHPVFVYVAPDEVTEIYAKDSVATITKKVLVGDTNEGTAGAVEFKDMKVGDPISFRLTGTLSSNYETFERYFYSFTDRQSDMLAIRPETVKVTLCAEDGTEKGDLTDEAKVDYDEQEHVLTVTFDALRKSAPEAVHTDTVRVDYQGYLTKEAPTGINSPSTNSASISFSPSPTMEWGVADTLITTLEGVRIYTFALDIVKVDREDPGKPLAGASFALRDVDTGRFLAKDGTWADGREDMYAHEVAADGTLILNGLSNGRYELIEVGIPEGYMLPANTIEFTVDTDVTAETPIMTVETYSTDVTLESADANTGHIVMRVMNDKEPPNPLGLLPLGVMIPTGIVIALLIALVAIIAITKATRKRNN